MTYLKRLIKDTAPNHEGGRAELSISHGHRQRIQLQEKATLAQDPCIILHFLTGSHVFTVHVP